MSANSCRASRQVWDCVRLMRCRQHLTSLTPPSTRAASHSQTSELLRLTTFRKNRSEKQQSFNAAFLGAAAFYLRPTEHLGLMRSPRPGVLISIGSLERKCVRRFGVGLLAFPHVRRQSRRDACLYSTCSPSARQTPASDRGCRAKLARNGELTACSCSLLSS